MTEAYSNSTSSVGSDDSLVLIEAADLPPTIEASSIEAPHITETFSYDSEEDSEQQGTPIIKGTPIIERTPVIATEVQLVDEIPSSPRSHSSLQVQDNDLPTEESDGVDVSRERKVGAGIAVGIVAAPFCGPVLAVIAGVAAAYGTSKPGAAGDACRAAGDIALIAKERAIEVDRKHDIMGKTKESANQIVDKARDANERHQIVENVKKMMACTLKNVAAALQFAADKMKETRNHSSDAHANSHAHANTATSNNEVKSTFSYEKVSVEVQEN